MAGEPILASISNLPLQPTRSMLRCIDSVNEFNLAWLQTYIQDLKLFSSGFYIVLNRKYPLIFFDLDLVVKVTKMLHNAFYTTLPMKLLRPTV